MGRTNYINVASFVSSGNTYTKEQVYDGTNLQVALTSSSTYICFRFGTAYAGRSFRLCWDEFYTGDRTEQKPVGEPLLRAAYYNGTEWKAPFYHTQGNALEMFQTTKYKDITIPDDLAGNYEIYFSRNTTVDPAVNLIVNNIWLIDLEEDISFEGLSIHRTTSVPTFKVDDNEHLYCGNGICTGAISSNTSYNNVCYPHSFFTTNGTAISKSIYPFL